ncbi:MAG: tetratricopeptide repeat protein [Deltaproteobacteria bacterium]|nr:tetratricopeptide repeat protein [Deltaproteobacteria bacterium]
MAKKISRKELLKGPDEFMTFSERAVAYVQEHSQAFIFAGVAAVVLLLGYLGVSWYLGYEDRKGQEAYNKAYYELRKTEASEEELTSPELPAELFEQVSSDYGLARVSSLALPQLARLRFQEGKVDEAISLYRRFQEENRENESYVIMAGFALAACYEARQDYEAAVEELRPLAEDPETFLRDQALVRLVRLHRLNGSLDKARETQETLAGEYPDSPFLSFTEGLLE